MLLGAVAALRERSRVLNWGEWWYQPQGWMEADEEIQHCVRVCGHGCDFCLEQRSRFLGGSPRAGSPGVPGEQEQERRGPGGQEGPCRAAVGLQVSGELLKTALATSLVLWERERYSGISELQLGCLLRIKGEKKKKPK